MLSARWQYATTSPSPLLFTEGGLHDHLDFLARPETDRGDAIHLRRRARAGVAADAGVVDDFDDVARCQLRLNSHRTGLESSPGERAEPHAVSRRRVGIEEVD